MTCPPPVDKSAIPSIHLPAINTPALSSIHLPHCQYACPIVNMPALLSMRLPRCWYTCLALSSMHLPPVNTHALLLICLLCGWYTHLLSIHPPAVDTLTFCWYTCAHCCCCGLWCCRWRGRQCGCPHPSRRGGARNGSDLGIRGARVGLVIMWQAYIRQWLIIRLTEDGPEAQRGDSCTFLATVVEHQGGDRQW